MNKDDKMYTNASKFYEVFGVELKENVDFCDICDYRGPSKCEKCPVAGHSFEFNKYVEPKETFKDTKQLFLDALSKEHEVVIGLAYSYAKNLDKYGVDINALWDNQEKNSQALGRAYSKGYFDALLEVEGNKNRGESNKGKWIYESNCWLRCSCCGNHFPCTSINNITGSNYCPNCGKEMESEVVYDK